MEKNLYN